MAQQFFAAYRLARTAAHSGDPDDIARRIAGFLPAGHPSSPLGSFVLIRAEKAWGRCLGRGFWVSFGVAVGSSECQGGVCLAKGCV